MPPTTKLPVPETALEMAKLGPFKATELQAKTLAPIGSIRQTLSRMKKMGLLKYTPPVGRERDGKSRKASGTWSAAVPVEKLVMPPNEKRPPAFGDHQLARTPGQEAMSADELCSQYNVKRLPVEKAKREPERAVPGVHKTAAAFFDAKEPLPRNRPVHFERGGHRA